MLRGHGFHCDSISGADLSDGIIFSRHIHAFSSTLRSSRVGYISKDILFTSLLHTVGVRPVLIHAPKRVFMKCCASSDRGSVGFLRAAVVNSISLSSFFPSRRLSSAVIKGSRGRVSHVAFSGSGRCTGGGCTRGGRNVRSNGLGCVFLRVSGRIEEEVRPVKG